MQRGQTWIPKTDVSIRTIEVGVVECVAWLAVEFELLAYGSDCEDDARRVCVCAEARCGDKIIHPFPYAFVVFVQQFGVAQYIVL